MFGMMKRIGLISDTHGYWDDRYESYFAECDEVWHAGDIGSEALADRLERLWVFRAVAGNIDNHKMRLRFGKVLRFRCEQVDVLLTHIGGYPGKYAPEIKKELATLPPKLFVCGHSHILKVLYDHSLEMLCMNPGAAGNFGFHAVRTLLRFVIDGENIKDLEVIELGERGGV